MRVNAAHTSHRLLLVGDQVKFMNCDGWQRQQQVQEQLLRLACRIGSRVMRFPLDSSSVVRSHQ
jgi:hypothetical protein